MVVFQFERSGVILKECFCCGALIDEVAGIFERYFVFVYMVLGRFVVSLFQVSMF